MARVGHVIYLHGFASSPASGKAQRFRRELEGIGVRVACPDLNEPNFETLTVTRMLAQVEQAFGAAPAWRAKATPVAPPKVDDLTDWLTRKA